MAFCCMQESVALLRTSLSQGFFAVVGKVERVFDLALRTMWARNGFLWMEDVSSKPNRQINLHVRMGLTRVDQLPFL